MAATALKDSVIFFNSAPFQIKNTGDFDYTALISQKIFESNIYSEHITHKTKIIHENQYLYSLDKVTNVIKKINQKEVKIISELFTRIYSHDFNNDQNRIQFVRNIKNYILLKSKLLNKKPILNIQMRAPQTGFLFMQQDLKQIKQQGIEIIITCHQYKVLFAKRHLQNIYHQLFKQAKIVFFFNENDLKNASKHASKIKLPKYKQNQFTFQPYNLFNKSFLTQVPPTTQYIRHSTDSLMNRQPNIIAFGMIRQSKGFQQALQIAKYIKNNKKQIEKRLKNGKNIPRVIIVGYPSSSSLIKQIINTKYGQNVITVSQIDSILQKGKENNDKNPTKQNINKLKFKINELNELYNQQSPIDLYLDVKSQQMPKLFNKAKYAIKFDEKGWANNASSHINAIANGLILFTGWGINTSNQVLPKRINKEQKFIQQGQFYQSIILPKNKYGLTFGQKMNIQQQISHHYGKFQHFKLQKVSDFYKKSNLITAKSIIQQIIQRQNNPILNFKTLNQANKLFQNKFQPHLVANSMIKDIQRAIF